MSAISELPSGQSETSGFGRDASWLGKIWAAAATSVGTRRRDALSDADPALVALEAVHRQGTLALRGVEKDYEVDNRLLKVLENINLVITPGEFVTLVGPSGCGKSTILRLIVGLDADFAGEILLDGHPIEGPGLERGIVFQEHRLLPWLTVEQNVGLALDGTPVPKKDRARLVREHIELVGLGGFERALPQQLSGGMAQRAAIARGLVSRPEVLLLDEPFGALDSLTRTYLQQELLRIWRQERITMLMVTHDVEEAVFLSNRVIVLGKRPGRIQATVPVDLPYPRSRVEPAFGAIRQSILNELGN